MSIQALSIALSVKGVSPTEKLLLLLLANYADEEMRCWPSHRRLADDGCLSRRTIVSTMQGLEARGLITRKERVRPDGSRATDIITLRVDAWGGGANSAQGGVQILHRGGAAASHLTTFEPSSEPKKPPIAPQGARELFEGQSFLHVPAQPLPATNQDFERWWAAYPRKVGKEAAKRSWLKALKSAKRPEVLLEALAKAIWSDDAKFIPHPATWLNQGRWMDEVEASVGADAPLSEADLWRQRVRGFKDRSFWMSSWGEEPGDPECDAPYAILQEMGYSRGS